MAERSDSTLRELAADLDSHDFAAELLDDQWRVVWVSEQLKIVLGETDHERLGYGEHLMAGRFRAVELSDASAERLIEANCPFMLHTNGGDREALIEMAPAHAAALIRELEPREPPMRWISSFDFARGAFGGRTSFVAERVHDDAGRLIGFLFLYLPATPVSLLALLSRGDQEMYGRMAALIEPARRSAAILFADLEGSGALSRRLPSEAYFRLISSVRSALEASVANKGGIAGKHAGDGVTAFFLSEQVGSHSSAARAALDTARAVPTLAREAAGALASEGFQVDAAECLMNVAVHWGPNLYMGQVASEGRLEVTALGDEVNEAARIEQSAQHGQILASKPLLEQLDPDDAAALELDLAGFTYQPLGEVEGADAKATRDAGLVAVTDVASSPSPVHSRGGGEPALPSAGGPRS